MSKIPHMWRTTLPGSSTDSHNNEANNTISLVITVDYVSAKNSN